MLLSRAAFRLSKMRTPGALSSCWRMAPSTTTTRFFSSKEDEEVEPCRENLWEKADLHRIFDNNRAWRQKKLKEDPEFFNKLAAGQKPEYLLIGCSDSRVGAQEIMGLHQGELFVHRNIANVFVSTDLNLLSVLFYSVNVLKVKEILVLGHYECGGVKAASQNKDLGLIEHWLHNIRDVQRLHAKELQEIEDPDQRHRRLVELNIQEQVFNLYGNSIVQQSQAKTGRPRIHGMVYDIKNGLLKYLDINAQDHIRKFRKIYTVADFRHHEPVDVTEVSSAEPPKHEHHLHIDKPHKAHLEDVATDRLVVIRPSGGQDPPKPLRCHASTTVLELKEAICTLTGTPVEQQNLYFNSVELKDEETCHDVGIVDISEVELREEIVPAGFQRPQK